MRSQLRGWREALTAGTNAVELSLENFSPWGGGSLGPGCSLLRRLRGHLLDLTGGECAAVDLQIGELAFEGAA